MAERPLSKKKRGRKRTSEDSAVMPPNPGPIIRAQGGINGGTEVPNTVENVERSAPHEFPHENLSRHEIKDRLAHGGVSMLERQHILATDIYMSDEDRAAYREDVAKSPAPRVEQLRVPRNATSTPGIQTSQLRTPGKAPDVATQKLPPSPHLERIKAPPSAPAFGAEGALAPQGILSPKGLLMSYGFMGPQGLLAPRSDRAQTLRSTSFKPQAGETSRKSVVSPQHFRPDTGSNSISATPSPSRGLSPRVAEIAGPSTNPEAPRPTTTGAYAAVQDTGGQHFSSAPIHGSGHSSTSHFQPVDTPVQNWLQKKGPSPIEEIFSRLFKLIGVLFGIGGDKNEASKKPHLRGGH